MAGIGFELRKVASLGSARGFFQASLSGIMIVAGPWLISILTILIFQQPVMGVPADFRRLFTASTVYTYSISLILNGGFHYIFTRVLSDYLYRNEKGRAFAFTVGYMLKSSVFLIPLAFVLMVCLFHDISVLHRAGFILLFVVINHIWILMLTASAMKRFNQLLLGYLIGMGSSLILMKTASLTIGSDGLLLAYALGQIVLFTIVLVFLMKDMGWDKTGRKREILNYALRYKSLFLTGFVYYGALWADKFIYWYLKGDPVENTAMRLFPAYDVIVYLTNLMMIPGLVFFVIYSETEYFMVLKKFLTSLSSKPYHLVRNNQTILIRTTRQIIKEQSGILIFTTLLFLIMALNHSHLYTQLSIVIPTALGIMMLGLFVCIINFLFYIEQYRFALFSSSLYLFINIALGWYGAAENFLMPGVSSLTGCTLGTATAGYLLSYSLRNLDRIMFTSITRDHLKKIREKNLKNT